MEIVNGMVITPHIKKNHHVVETKTKQKKKYAQLNKMVGI